MSDIHAEAMIAARHWGEPLEPPRLVSTRENHVFSVHYEGTRAALRLHRPAYQAAETIRSELVLTQALAASGFAVPGPIPTPEGALLAGGPTRLASLITWCEGAAFGAGGRPLSNAPQQMANLGETIAKLHLHLDRLSLPEGFTRPRWDAEGFLGAAPNWGRFWESHALTAQERDEIDAFRRTAAKALTQLQDFGLIHADLLRENIMVSDGALVLIDFDDCGFGYRLFDLAVALVQSLSDHDLPQQIDALLGGYTALRPLGGTRRDLTLMLALRLCASIGWFAARAPAADTGHRERIERALPIVRLWQGGGAL